MASRTRNVILIVILFSIGFGFYSHFYWEDTFKQFIGTFAGVATTIFIGSMAHLISLAFEDRNKITSDYELIKKMYSAEQLTQTVNFLDGTSLSFVYKGVPTIIKEIKVVDDNKKMYLPTEVMSSNFTKLFNAHRGAYKKNVFTVRVDDVYDDEASAITLYTSRSTYFNHLISNRVMDYPFAKSLTLRSLYEPGPDITPLKHSVFSNHLGIIGIIETADNFYILNKRSKTGSTSKDFLVSPIAFGLTAGVKENVNEAYITNKVIEKTNERLKKTSTDTINHIRKIIPVGYGRDIYEAGKPHLFYLVKINLTKDEYLELFYHSPFNKHTIDFNHKAFAIKANDFGYHDGFFHMTHHNHKGIKKTHLMKAETNLIMNIKCLIDLGLFKTNE
ncbi:hypothetical protein [Acholeplasma hippikon]|nr:hypothetical protein [Acholeplasma hippikon]